MKVFKNFLYNVLYQMLIMVLPLLTAPYIARVLGAEKIGIYSYTYSIAYYFFIFGQLGFSLYGNRTIAMNRDDREKLSQSFSSIYSLQFIISMITIIIYFAYVFIIGTDEYRMFFLLQSFYVVSTVFDISWFFFGIEKFKLTVGRNTVIKLLTVFLIFGFVKDKGDLNKYILIMALGQLIGQVFLWLNIRKYIDFKKINFRECIVHLKPVIILFLPTIATSLYRVMDKIMLGSLVEIEQLGFYENSEKFIAISMGVINALGTVMIPQISNLVVKGEREKIKDYINKSMEGIFILSVPITFGLAAISEKLAVVFYGNDFFPCGKMIFYLAFSIIFATWANVIRTQYLIPNKKDKEYIISMFTGAIVNLCINFYLIPRIGAIGVAIGTILAELIVAIMHSIYSRKELELYKYLKKIIPYFICGIIMFFITYSIRNVFDTTVIGLFLMILIGATTYILLTITYIIISKNQIYYIIKEYFNKMIRRNKKTVF